MRDSSSTVLVLNQFAKPRSAAGGTRHIELFGRLRGWRFQIVTGDVDLYTRRRYRVREPGFTSVRVTHYQRNDHWRVLNWLSYCAGAFRVGMRGERPDVVYASSPHLLTPLVGWVLARLRGSRFVLEVRDLWPQTLVELSHMREGSASHRAFSVLERWLCWKADHIVTVTDGWLPHFERLGVDPSRITTVSNSAEPEDFLPNPQLVPLRERVPVHGRLVVFAGALGAANGVQALVDAAAALPQHTFVLIGDGMVKPRLIAYARELSLSNVHFLDPIPKEEFCGILAGADIAVHTVADLPLFRRGMSPNKLYDYLAAGVPVVTTAEGEPETIVQSADAGIRVPPEQLATAIRKLAELDESELARMSSNAIAYVRRHKSRTVQARRLQTVLDKLV
ncbi:glycosyltransferase family 4 protein [Saccharopolyspora hattusasensis]|uniref:glycosyltransferase family 4 protein n=1 Tax=Saccharopolyspora hattusasensis TaxID=1128679 RepID=UPI003D97CA69